MNIPIFVPHVGCPNSCAFCNQRCITGETRVPTIEKMRRTVDAYLSGGKNGPHTIAFFGGSFTGIDFELQRAYLSAAKEYLDRGLVDGIRLSTRPDYIDGRRLDLLEEYGVTNVELGAQSMDDRVLAAVGRGHSAKDVERAAELIKKRGFVTGLQMMTGLPLDTAEGAERTAREFVRLGAEEARIYPTLVMENTALADMLRKGEYTPWEIEPTVELCAKLYAIFKENGVRVLRIGLSDSEELKGGCVGGPYHPAMGELVIGRYIRNELEKAVENGRLEISAPKKYFSKIIGNKKCNEAYFRQRGVEFSVKQGEKILVNGKPSLSI